MKHTFSFIICFIPCIQFLWAQRAFSDEQLEHYLPKKEVNYKLARKLFVLTDTSVVSPNAVYVLESEEVERKDYKVVETLKSYTWMRFFNDGRVFISFSYLSYPSESEFNDLSYGKYGRYIIEDGEIIIEFYQNRQYGVMFMFARKNTAGIQFYATSFRLRPIIKKRSTDQGFYRKDYTSLYNWPPPLED